MLCNWIIRRNNPATKIFFYMIEYFPRCSVTATRSTYRQATLSNTDIGYTFLLGVTTIMRSIEWKHLRWCQSIYTSTEMNSVLTILLYASTFPCNQGQEFGMGFSLMLLCSRNRLNILDLNCLPLSCIIFLGFPLIIIQCSSTSMTCRMGRLIQRYIHQRNDYQLYSILFDNDSWHYY